MSSPGRKPGRFDRFDQQLDGFFVRLEVRREPALVADHRRQLAVVQHLLQRVVALRAPLQRLTKRGRADGHDHELLQVDVVVGVCAAVEHVHHRHRATRGRSRRRRSGRGASSSSSAPPWRSPATRRGWRWRRGGLVVGAVEVAKDAVDRALLECVDPLDRVGDLTVDVVDGALHALAHVALATVAQLDRFELAGRRARRHDGPPAGTRLENHLDLDGRVSARIEDLAADDELDVAHDNPRCGCCSCDVRGKRTRSSPVPPAFCWCSTPTYSGRTPREWNYIDMPSNSWKRAR